MQELNALRDRLGRARTELNRRLGHRDRLQAQRAEAAAQAEAAGAEAALLEQVGLLLQMTAEQARRQACDQIQRLVTSTLQAVFGPEYSFRIELVERGGRPEAEFYVVSTFGGEPLQTRPGEARGGGVVDLVSLGLRIAMLETYRPALAGPMVLDEPAKHVSDEFIQPVAQLLELVSQSFGRQVIMVTHSAHLAESGATAYRVQLQGDCSVVSRLDQSGL